MSDVRTHRDLYRAALAIAARHTHAGRTLETWLRALLGGIPRIALREELSVDELLRLLDDGFTGPPAQFDPAWSKLPPCTPRDDATVGDVVQALQRQIWELHELARIGALSEIDRGVGAPADGGRWFATDPAGFIEAGLQGAFGGYALEESSRSMIDTRGPIGAGQSGEIVVRAIPMTHVTWGDVHSLLVNGQCYL